MDKTLTNAEKIALLAVDQSPATIYKIFGYVNCPCCGFQGLSVTKAGKIRKHGSKQTGNSGLSCEGSGIKVF